MGVSNDLKLFESYLNPILKTAYGTALYVTCNDAKAMALIEQATLHAYSRFPTLTSDIPFKAWFLHILTDLFLQQPRWPEQEAELMCWEVEADACLAQQEHSDSAGTADTLRHLRQEAILAGFAALPREYRPICALYFLDEWSYQEISEIVGCTVAMARQRLHRGRRWLQCHFQSARASLAGGLSMRRDDTSSHFNSPLVIKRDGSAALSL